MPCDDSNNHLQAFIRQECCVNVYLGHIACVRARVSCLTPFTADEYSQYIVEKVAPSLLIPALLDQDFPDIKKS